MTSAFSWQNSISLFPASFCIPRPYLPVTPGVSWLPAFAFQSHIMKRTSFLGVSSKRSQVFIEPFNFNFLKDSLMEPIFAWNVPLVSLIFLKKSLVFLILLFSSISLHWSLRKAFLSLLAIFWNCAFKWVYLSLSPLPFTSLLFTAICKTSSDNYFAFFAFLFLGDGLDQCLLYNVMNLCL